MDGRETPNQTTVKKGIEDKIKENYLLNDMLRVNRGLDRYPYGKERSLISEERAHEIARGALVRAAERTHNANQVTTEFAAVDPRDLEAEL